MRELKSIEEKILDRTLYLIGKTGSVNVSVRAIVHEAGVNIGAINYYFGTKENMLNHVKQFYVENTMSTIAYLEDETMNDEDKLVSYGCEIMEYCIRFPGVSALIKDAQARMETDEMSRKIIQALSRMYSKLDEVLQRYLQEGNSQFEMKKMIYISSIVYPTERYSPSSETYGYLDTESKRREYIRMLVKLIYKQ
ncbi:TetR/AcrR family transcriptional regulator [Proteiniclasticum sp.]|uniref:TetR/AcrR family transcriptional regulator n=1 Tax=Proteiniclasticum sp. TaxID=2053595 RepID=UPI00289C77BE|nr:TetR/AcrR family transcriptional regulator [Proteiniclasticum sp.]